MAQPPATADLNAFLANPNFNAPLTRLIAPATPAAPDGLGLQNIPAAQNPPVLGGLFAPDAANALGGSGYFNNRPNGAPWQNQNNIQDYTGMYDANNHHSPSMYELIVQGENILWPVGGAPPRPDDQVNAVARRQQIQTLGFDITNQPEAEQYDEIMIKAAVGHAKQILRNRIYSLAYTAAWRNYNTTGGLIQRLDNISQQITRALDNAAPGGQAQADLVPLQDMLMRLVSHMAGGDIPQAVQDADELVNALNQQVDMGNISQLLGGTLQAEIRRLNDALQAHLADAAANGRPNPVPGAPPGPAGAIGLIGGRKSKKTKRKSKTRKVAKKTGKKRKGGYKFTRAANSRRSLRMKTRKLKSLTQKSPKKKHAKKHGKKHAKKHGKKHGKKSKYHKARSEKHKRGKR